jgi:hypothetical protein
MAGRWWSEQRKLRRSVVLLDGYATEEATGFLIREFVEVSFEISAVKVVDVVVGGDGAKDPALGGELADEGGGHGVW